MRQRDKGTSGTSALRRGRQTVMVGAALAVAACSGTPPAPLEDVCQFRTCVCADVKAAFWQLGDTKPLIWGATGAPYCPAGYALRQTGEP